MTALQGQVALVSGGGRGIGKATVAALLATDGPSQTDQIGAQAAKASGKENFCNFNRPRGPFTAKYSMMHSGSGYTRADYGPLVRPDNRRNIFGDQDFSGR